METSATQTERVLSTLNADGSRRWLCPRPAPGRFLRARRLAAVILIGVFTAIPYIEVGGRPLVLLDVMTRHFTIFGATFLPTDTVLLALSLVGFFVTIFLLTALLGRVWCGWACPQTVYMEFVFRPLERLFDGAPGRRRRGIQGTGAGTALKYASYVLVSLYLAHTFLAYFVGVDRLASWVTRSPLEHPTGFLVVVCVTGLMLFDFAFFREQTCIVACPYGRFQSALLDSNSLIISYDRARGEPRGKRRHDTVPLPVLGDCVDCGMCVTTCPTGIDIRDGLQMECVGCAQCIDACDAVMTRIGRPRGLIRYTSQTALQGRPTRLLRARVLLYPLVLLVIATAIGIAAGVRGPANITILRGLGGTFTRLPDGTIANQVRVKIVNRADRGADFEISADGAPGVAVRAERNPVHVAAGETRTSPAMIVAPPAVFRHGRCDITIRVSGPDGFVRQTDWELMGPADAPEADDHSEETDR